ncbi:MAG: methylenetetrahydrofolate reductase [NAD(P)H] [Phycisphaeraceae bacterium]
MHIQDILGQHQTTCSFEFFPPKTPAGAETLFENIAQLEPLKPAFVSVTYGAGGSTREMTHDLVVRIKETTSLDPIPHLTCVCHQEAEIRQILERYAKANVSNILALGGDPPRDMAAWDRSKDAFRHAADLVRFIRAFNEQHAKSSEATFASSAGRGFGIGVAGFPEGHPATPNRLVEMDHLKAKVDAGADYICTQLFFDNRDFYDFCERCELAGIKVPIIAGIMPVASAKSMQRMADLAAGARFPAPLLKAIQRADASGDEEAVQRVGIHWAAKQCLDLIDHHVRGIHFYTLNKSDATKQIYQSLGLRDSVALR